MLAENEGNDREGWFCQFFVEATEEQLENQFIPCSMRARGNLAILRDHKRWNSSNKQARLKVKQNDRNSFKMVWLKVKKT